MSSSGDSSSSKWDEILSHGSALGILKPDIAFPPTGGSSGSGGSSGGSSGSTGSGSSSGSNSDGTQS
ncbi:hypothetical protein VTJ49DRAFT_807 [Mycothermus thermophilus]|uniref:Uncharacterized protein n=1 Tax=Humicola insolens TaxID=85995 RepID=A0ABR3VE37_HUMIN